MMSWFLVKYILYNYKLALQKKSSGLFFLGLAIFLTKVPQFVFLQFLGVSKPKPGKSKKTIILHKMQNNQCFCLKNLNLLCECGILESWKARAVLQSSAEKHKIYSPRVKVTRLVPRKLFLIKIELS